MEFLLSLDAMNALGLQPVFKYLKEFFLPNYPVIMNITSSSSANHTKNPNGYFDWVKSVARIKKIIGTDLIVGFDIFPDPVNQSVNRLVFGVPDGSEILPLYKIFSF